MFELATHSNGTTREKRRFAFLPKVVSGSLIMWRFYRELWVHEHRSVIANIEGKSVAFVIGNWVKVSESIL